MKRGKGLGDRSKAIISIFVILYIAIAIFFFLFFSTDLFNQDIGSKAQIKNPAKSNG